MTAFVKDLHRKPVQSVIEIHTPGCTVNTNNAIHLYYAEKLLLNTSFYLAEDKVKIEDFYPVWKCYKEVKACFDS